MSDPLPPNLTPPDDGQAIEEGPIDPMDPRHHDEGFRDAIAAAAESGEWMLGLWWVERAKRRPPVTRLVTMPHLFPNSEVDAALSCMVDQARQCQDRQKKAKKEFWDSLPQLPKPPLTLRRPN